MDLAGLLQEVFSLVDLLRGGSWAPLPPNLFPWPHLHRLRHQLRHVLHGPPPRPHLQRHQLRVLHRPPHGHVQPLRRLRHLQRPRRPQLPLLLLPVEVLFGLVEDAPRWLRAHVRGQSLAEVFAWQGEIGLGAAADLGLRFEDPVHQALDVGWEGGEAGFHLPQSYRTLAQLLLSPHGKLIEIVQRDFVSVCRCDAVIGHESESHGDRAA
mmetsp:Transcript_42987/g.103593  ORF Transcript_42987/g.103593 Transcript_42987/m.103593 type:complete len:210 (+) Transcript_42987:541-1170(+)